MAEIDTSNRTITLKIVYYGCAMGGKTTNLVMLQRLTDPASSQGMVTLSTQDDRTLFFDLLPMSLGQIGGLNVKCRLYTVPGQMHYEVTRRHVLDGADGIVFVVDSTPSENQANLWAMENLRLNLLRSRLDPAKIPTVLQYNKRDARGARPLGELEAELNTERRPTVPAVAIEGTGIVETFAAIAKATVRHCYKKTGRVNVFEKTIDQPIDRALCQTSVDQPRLDAAVRNQFSHRFDMEAYRDEQASQGRARQIVDLESLLGESVKANMALAETLDDRGQVAEAGDRRKCMMQTLGWLILQLTDPDQTALPTGMLARLLEGACRQRGSVLFFKPEQEIMEENEVEPAGPDLLNGIVSTGLGSVAYRLSRERHVRIIEDLTTEVFYGNPPRNAEELGAVLIAPMACDGSQFGSVIVYSRLAERGFDETEVEFWTSASTLMGLSAHWRALRRKVMEVAS